MAGSGARLAQGLTRCQRQCRRVPARATCRLLAHRQGFDKKLALARAARPIQGLHPPAAPPCKRHLGGHDGVKHHVGLQRRVGHVEHRLANYRNVPSAAQWRSRHWPGVRLWPFSWPSRWRHSRRRSARTAMLRFRPSSEAVLVSPMTACLVAVYAMELGRGVWAEIDPLLMRKPADGALGLHHTKGLLQAENMPLRLMSTTLRHCSMVSSSSGTPGALTPAFIQQHVDSAPGVDHGVEEGVHRIRVGHISGHSQDAITRTKRQPLSARGLAGRPTKAHALQQQGQCSPLCQCRCPPPSRSGDARVG